MLIPRCKFVVVLEIHQISKFPQSNGKMIVRWHIADSPRAETRGRTDEVAVEDHQASFKYHTEFTYYLGIGANKTLRSGTLEFDVGWLPVGSRNRMSVGLLKLDIAQFVNREPENHIFLLENSRANVLLHVTLNVKQIKGPTNYSQPKFDAPVMNDKLHTLGEHGNKKNPISDPVTSKRAYLAYLQHFKQSQSHVNPLMAVMDIVKGGDGFCSIPMPEIPRTMLVGECIADGEKPNRPILEDELRDNFSSWSRKLGA